MALSSWPRAYLELPQGGAVAVARSTAASASDAFRSEYHAVESFRMWPARAWVVIVTSGIERLAVVISAVGSTAIKISVAHLAVPSLIDLFRGQERPITPALRTLSLKVHSLLTGIEGGSGLRWYVRAATTSVATPGDLPW